MSLSLEGKNLTISLRLQMLNWGPHLTKRSQLPLSPAGRMGPRAFSWAAEAKWVTWKAKLMSEVGWQSPGQAGFWHCCLPRAGGEEEPCTAESGPPSA